jgi:hypothetical protein
MTFEKFSSKSNFLPSKSQVMVPKSEVIAGIEWMAEQISYPDDPYRGDTYALTWAADNNIYASAGDPVSNEHPSGLDVECFSGEAPEYRITKINEMADYTGWGGAGPKPSGMISVNGILYLAFQNATGKSESQIEGSDAINNYGHGYDAQIVRSDDYGLSWTPDIKELKEPMFPGRVFGAPNFINFGKDNSGARDSYIYTISGEGWDNGNCCRLARVPADSIMNRDNWEWVSDFSENDAPVWSFNMEEAIPVLSHPGYLGTVDMVYIASIKRYLLLSWHHKVKAVPGIGSELIIYDAPEPWGPFTLAHHEDLWESREMNPYNPRLPLKWFDADKLEGWLQFSGSWINGGTTSFYRSHIRKFKLLLK